MEALVIAIIVSFVVGSAMTAIIVSIREKIKEENLKKAKERKKLLREALIRRHLIARARKRRKFKQESKLDKTHDKQS